MEFPTPDEIINGTYKPKPPAPVPRVVTDMGATAGAPTQLAGPPELEVSDEHKKALNLVMQSVFTGSAVMVVGMKPTYGDPDNPTLATGCDFFTTLSGDKDTLLAAKEHLPEVIANLYNRKGIV